MLKVGRIWIRGRYRQSGCFGGYCLYDHQTNCCQGAPKKNWNDLSVLSTLSIRPSNSHGKSLKPQSLFSISTFLSKTTNWQPVSTTNPQIPTVTYCTRLPTHLTSKTQFRIPNFSDSVGSAAKIQTLTPNATKCLISFPNVAILTASCLKHSIVSKTSIENPL